MKIIIKPGRDECKELLKRPYEDNHLVLESVQSILNAVKQHGDEAVRSFTKKFDGVELEAFGVTSAEILNAEAQLSQRLQKAIQQAQMNIEKFHSAQLDEIKPIETMPGVQCWRKNTPVEKVGLYI